MKLSLAIIAVLFLIISLSNFIYAANNPPQIGTITPSSGNSNPNETVTFTTTFINQDEELGTTVFCTPFISYDWRKINV